jgi:hypothetical protein
MPMLFVALAAIFSSPPPPRAASAVAQATVTIRVISAVRLKLDGSASSDAPPPRSAIVRAADGMNHPAKLIEFQ